MKDLSEKSKSELEGLAFMSDYVFWRALWVALAIMVALIVWSVLGYPLPKDLTETLRPEWVTMVGRFVAVGLLALAFFYRRYAKQVRSEISFR